MVRGTFTMQPFEAIILGVVQGITEFLPISSTGHLILAREVLGLQAEFGLAVDATLHFATAFAVLLYFRHDIVRLAQTLVAWILRHETQRSDRTLLLALAIGTIPAVALGLLLESQIETIFRSAAFVAWVLLAGSALFVLAEWVAKRYEQAQPLTLKSGVLIGCFQALALLPGMSRSGATISGGMLLGLSREASARFAFLLSFPIILGAGSKKLLDLGGATLPAGEWHMITLAACAAFLAGIVSIHYLLKFLKNHSLLVFVVYRVALAMVVFAML